MRADDGYNLGEFVDGQIAAAEGLEPEGDESESWVAGYSTQRSLEIVRSGFYERK